MTTLKTMKVITTAAALAAAVSVGATETPDRGDDLRAARERVAFEAGTTKGTPSQQMRQEERALQRLINDLERGENVDPAEIDRALERAGRIR